MDVCTLCRLTLCLPTGIHLRVFHMLDIGRQTHIPVNKHITDEHKVDGPMINECTSIHIYIHTYICVYMYICICICMYMCIYVHVCIYICIYAYVFQGVPSACLHSFGLIRLPRLCYKWHCCLQ